MLENLREFDSIVDLTVRSNDPHRFETMEIEPFEASDVSFAPYAPRLTLEPQAAALFGVAKDDSEHVVDDTAALRSVADTAYTFCVQNALSGSI